MRVALAAALLSASAALPPPRARGVAALERDTDALLDDPDKGVTVHSKPQLVRRVHELALQLDSIEAGLERRLSLSDAEENSGVLQTLVRAANAFGSFLFKAATQAGQLFFGLMDRLTDERVATGLFLAGVFFPPVAVAAGGAGVAIAGVDALKTVIIRHHCDGATWASGFQLLVWELSLGVASVATCGIASLATGAVDTVKANMQANLGAAMTHASEAAGDMDEDLVPELQTALGRKEATITAAASGGGGWIEHRFSHADICGDFSPRNQREQEVITEPIYSGDGDEWGEQTRVVDTSSTGAMVSRAASALRSAWSRVRRNSWVEPVAFEDLLTSLDY